MYYMLQLYVSLRTKVFSCLASIYVVNSSVSVVFLACTPAFPWELLKRREPPGRGRMRLVKWLSD